MAYIYDDSQTYTGEIVNFTSTDKANITSVSVPLTYSQDLHGYANPWPAGGGKNKVDISAATVSSQTVLYSVDLSAGTYTLSAYCTNNASINGYLSLRLSGVAKGTVTIASGDTNTRKNASFTLTESGTYDVVGSGASSGYNFTVSNVQLESGSTMTDFAPYENICPISGITGLSVYRTGKNLGEFENGYNIVADGSIGANAKRCATVNPIKIFNGISYVFTSETGLQCIYAVFNGNTLVRRTSGIASGSTLDTSGGTDLYVCAYGSSDYTATVETDKPMVRSSSSSSDYEPYNGNTYSVDWSTQAGTVCHGTVDPVAGQLTVDKVYKSFDGSSTTGIGVYNPLSGFWFTLPGMSANYSADGLCNIDKTRTSYGTGGVIFGIGNNNYAYFTNLQTISGASTVADLCSWLQSNNLVIEFVYPLATPITYQLTPKQIAALTNNYVWASNGASITVTVSDILHDFQGWLLKVGSGMTLVPTEMIKAETYKVSPNQRMEETAERDSTGVLWRETVPNMPPKIEFNTPAAYDTDVNALNAIFRAAYSNKQERKLTVAFYDPEENVYKTWECYMPNIDFPIRTIDIDAKTIFYDEIRYAFIGY